jgi:hypothetical protein
MFTPPQRVRLLLLTGIVVCVATFIAATKLFHIPAHVGFGGVILQEPSPISSFVALSAALVVCVLVGTLIAGSVRFDAGLFCAVLGMVAVSLRSGTLGDVLRTSAGANPVGGPTVFIGMAGEILLLYAVLGLAWSTLWLLHRQDFLKADQFRDGVEDTQDPLGIKVCALIMQAAATALLMLLLAQSDSKTQVLWSLAIASYLGAILAYFLYPIAPSPWLWAGPLIVGLAGYLGAYMMIRGEDPMWRTGQLLSADAAGQPRPLWMAPLVRALPIDYATVGTAAAILGYWMSRKWHQQRIAEAGESPAGSAAKNEALDRFFGKAG